VSDLLVLFFIDFTTLLLILYSLKYQFSNIFIGFSGRGKMIDGSIYPGRNGSIYPSSNGLLFKTY